MQQARLYATWRQVLVKFGLLTLFGALIGWVFDHALLGLTTVLAGYLGTYLRNLWALRAWLEAPKQFELPEPGGLWGEVFDQLLDRQKKNSKRKRKLAAMLAEFQASTAALPDGAVVLGERGEINWFNQAAQALLGLRAPNDVGLRVPNLIRHPSFNEYFQAGNFSGEIEMPSPVSRNQMLSLRIIPYGNNQKLLIVRDVSELKRLETARRDFVANASHELRTPLTVLKGYLEMLVPESQGKGPLSAWRGPLTEMKNQTHRMESVVNDMLRLARLEAEMPSKPDVIDVAAMLTRVIEEAKAVSGGAHRFQAHFDAKLFLLGIELEAQSIFSNLVTNAVRYTPAGGLIRVEWKAQPQGAVFICADTGIGIAEPDIPRLTERFYRVDVGRSRASGGTGLGLSIVKHGLERHEAALRIESELGVGSTFTCSFPPHRLRRVAVTEATAGS